MLFLALSRPKGVAAAEPAGNERHAFDRTWPLVLALALPALVYFPIMRNFFYSDDFLHLYDIVNTQLWEFLLSMHGGHLLMTRNAIFALTYRAFGTDTVYYFSIVLATHLFNVYLLFRIIQSLTDSTRLACFGSALWGTLPVQEGVLGWYSVYGHALVATFLFPVLLGLARIARGQAPHRLAPVAWVVLLLAASTSFGVGIAVTLVMPAVAFLLLPPSSARTRAVLVFSAVALATPFFYFGVLRYYSDTHGGFGLWPLILAWVSPWHQHLRLFCALVVRAVTSLVLGVFDSPRLCPSTVCYLLVATYTAALVFAFWRASGRARLQALACATIFAATYGLIAVGRSFLTGGDAPWMASSPRFHYVGTSALVVATCLALASLGSWRGAKPWLKTGLLLAWAGVTVAGHFATGRPVIHFHSARRETEHVLVHVRRAAKLAVGDDVWIQNRPFNSIGMMMARNLERFPGWAAVFTIYFPDNSIAGKRVRFVEDNPAVIESARSGRRSATLLVSPEEAPATIYRPPELPRRRFVPRQRRKDRG